MTAVYVCKLGLFLLLTVVVFVTPGCWSSPREERFWPLNNDTNEVNLGQSSPFGPRLKNSEGSRYDFHRGVDIPTPLLTEVYAIDDGTVRITGLYHSGFSDGVVQLRHCGWEDDGDPSKQYFSTYLHMNISFIEGRQDEFIPKGTVLGLTGTTNNFPHLHFEVRAGSLFSEYACNPWKYLPCGHCSPFKANVTIALSQMEDNCSATVQVSVPPNQLTFAGVCLEVTGAATEYNRTVDLCEVNIFHTQNPYRNTTRLDDNTAIPNLVINPHFFNSGSFERNEWSAVDYTFLNLPVVEDGSVGMAAATVYDVHGQKFYSTPVYYSSSCSQVVPTELPTNPQTEPTNPSTTDLDNMESTSASIAQVPMGLVLQSCVVVVVMAV